MGSREDLHNQLLTFIPNVYFIEPPSNQMQYPCIVYRRNGKTKLHGNNGIYYKMQGWSLTLIEYDEDSPIADDIESTLQYCSIDQQYVVDNLPHTTLTLFY